ncbi:peptidase U32 [Spirochaetia bacterium]|nr:peptidase U32 [Spirochaetia bacterium]
MSANTQGYFLYPLVVLLKIMNVELLAPAGSMEALNAAVAEGADAVYLGLKSFNARMRSGNFAYSEFDAALKAMHRMGRKIYVAVNTVFQQREADRMYQHLQYLNKVGADGIIVQDFGVLQMCRQNFPALKLHASTQMNVASGKGVNLLSKMGCNRVVLSRELSFEELKMIRGECNMELEIFVHGALCVSASGVCLFSSFLGGKSANRGMCTQACRRLYKKNDDGDGQTELERGKYYFSPNDLCLIEHIPQLIKLGINSFKIEGRMKSAEYCGTVVRAYRKVIDACNEKSEEVAGDTDGMNMIEVENVAVKDAVINAKQILQRDFARAKTTFHFDDTSSWLNPDQDGGTGIKLGFVEHVKITENSSVIEVRTNTKLHVGDSIRLHKSDDSVRQSFKVKAVDYRNDASRQGVCFITVSTDGEFIYRPGDSIYIIQTKEQSRHYPPLIARNATFSTLKPSYDKAPFVHYKAANVINTPSKTAGKVFAAGTYAAISNISDMYIAQSIRASAIIINCGLWNLKKLLRHSHDANEGVAKSTLPFRNSETIISLNPFFGESDAEAISDAIDKLISIGYKRFIVNNLGHISLFLNKNVTLCAGQYLYTFNRFSVSFLRELGIEYFIPPLEISRQNLERVFEKKERMTAFVTIFAYPHLFYIPGDIKKENPEHASLKKISDTRGENFNLRSEDGFSAVLPVTPFSITDKVQFLKQAGFNKFIVDFSGSVIKKHEYKKIMQAALDSTLIEGALENGASRFNYKDGFYEPIDKEGVGNAPVVSEREK